MPCLNEALTLATCIEKANSFLAKNGVKGEVIIADNGSTDGSQAIATRLGARVVDIPIRGYGAALFGGIMAAEGEYVIMGDSDDSYDFTNLMPYVEKLRQGYDLVMGNRFKGGIGPGAMPFLHKYLGNPVLSFVGKLFFSTGINDFHCGLRGFRRDAAVRMDLRTTGMEFASEMVVKASLMKMRITEVPTTLKKDGRDRPPHLRTWRDGWRHLRFLLMYSPRWLFLLPGGLLVLIGILMMAVLTQGQFKIGSVIFDVHTLLFGGAFIIIGYQSIMFSLFTKVFAISEGLLPVDDRLTRLVKVLNLENGLIAGVLLLLGGLVETAWALNAWQEVAFGDLGANTVWRQVIPGVVFSILGVQTIFSSFFLGILGLRRKSNSLM